MHKILFILLILLSNCQAQTKQKNTADSSNYLFMKPSLDGTGKYYFGREISHVMGHQGADWLEREERELEENPSIALQAIKKILNSKNAVVADIGAGSGYYAFRLANLLPEGKVYAVDIQPEMLEMMRAKHKKEKVNNIALVLATETNPKLPDNLIDLALFVDVYHELAYPREVMLNLLKSMKKGGKVILLEFKAEDDDVPIKPLHKTSEKQIRKELESVGLKFVENKQLLPWQHFLVFEKI